jgi:ferredoxin-type protein NapH
VTTAIGRPGSVRRGWLLSHKWLMIRRVVQCSVLGLFALGPYAGVWILKGNLSSSLLLDTVPLADPLVTLQSLAAGHVPESALLLGASLVALTYLLLGGRTFCSFVCPVNLLTDGAAAARRRLGIRPGKRLDPAIRFWMLGLVLVLPVLTGTILWELLNPVALSMRGLLFGAGMGWLILIGIFVLDTFVSQRAWCGHLCPLGAFYALLGRMSPIKVSAARRTECDDCMDCFSICPEPQVIKMPLKGDGTPVIEDSACTRCGRCMDVCTKRVFRFELLGSG